MGSDAPRALAFFQRCWDYARDGRDVEASDVQDWGEEFGLLTKVSVAAPCGAGCWCEEYYGEFPVDCYRPVEGVGAPTPAMIDTLIAHRWSATQVWPNDDAKVYCRCGALLLGTTEAEAHATWAAHVFDALRAALTAQDLPTEEQPTRQPEP